MKNILMAVLALALAACASTPGGTNQVLGTATILMPAIQGHGTLGALGDPEYRAGPHVTQMSVLLHRTDLALNRKQISSAQAKEVLAATEVAEATVRKAVAAEKAGRSSEATQLLLIASKQIGNATQILETAQKGGVK